MFRYKLGMIVLAVAITQLQALPLNKVKGNIAECVYDGLQSTIGKIYGEYNVINGIDHILVKRSGGKITDCIITDSKFGTARLAGERLDLQSGMKDLDQLSNRHLLQILDRLDTGDYSDPGSIGKMDEKDARKIVRS